MPHSAMPPNPSLAAALAALLLATLSASGGDKNLLPNGGFEGTDALHGWLTVFPDEEF